MFELLALLVVLGFLAGIGWVFLCMVKTAGTTYRAIKRHYDKKIDDFADRADD